ncbi:hypothetical protein [Prochlorococcus sp. MIT 1307]|uniref:hypothetical protein n=1 Tax=Prochlorococcus sp. MIT 1307 TaxID=3096219 RepID=UPI002A751412|nr:hypothetical protein [Prochlorococcus sp. MIT 1307]
MKNIPKKCDICGAPIVWDEVSSSIKCDFCGGKTYIRSKFIFVQRVKDSAYKTLAPVGKSLSNVGRELLEKQSILSDDQVNRIGTKANKVIRNRYFKLLLVTVPIALVANSIINDPIRPYKAEIEEECKLVASQNKTEYSSKNTYSRCTNSIYRNIRIIHRKGKDLRLDRIHELNASIKGNYNGSGSKYNTIRITSGSDIEIEYFQTFGEYASIDYKIPDIVKRKIKVASEREEFREEKKKREEERRKREEERRKREEERRNPEIKKMLIKWNDLNGIKEETDKSKRDQAKKDIQKQTKSIRKYDSYYRGYLDRGNAKLKLGRYRDSITEYSRAINIYAKKFTNYYYEAYLYRAYAKAKINDQKGMCRDLKIASETKDGAHFYYGVCTDEKNPYIEFEETIDEILKLMQGMTPEESDSFLKSIGDDLSY